MMRNRFSWRVIPTVQKRVDYHRAGKKPSNNSNPRFSVIHHKNGVRLGKRL